MPVTVQQPNAPPAAIAFFATAFFGGRFAGFDAFFMTVLARFALTPEAVPQLNIYTQRLQCLLPGRREPHGRAQLAEIIGS
jgi:hypothetical protein